MELIVLGLVIAAVIVALVRYLRNVEIRDDLDDDFDVGAELPRNGRDDRVGRSQP